jgi:uncharacterized OB-fold protein
LSGHRTLEAGGEQPTRVTGGKGIDLRPSPIPTEWSTPYWDGAAVGRLILQRCRDCGHWNHPPGLFCPNCSGESLGNETIAGGGAITHLVVVHQTKIEAFEGRVPYLVVAAEMDEQADLVLLGNVLDVDPFSAEIGMRIRIAFERQNSAVTLPQFVLDSGQ